MKKRFPRLAEQYEVPIRTLKPGRKFRMYLSTSNRFVQGEVVYLTKGAATVIVPDDRLYRSRSLHHWDLDTLVIPDKDIKRFPRIHQRFPRLKHETDTVPRFPRIK